MLVGIYIAAFVLSMLCLIILMFERIGNNEAYYALVLVSIAVSSGGYMFESLATTIGEVVIAAKLSSVGSCFLSVLLLCIILRLQNLKPSRLITGGVVAASAAVLAMIFTFDYHHFFYRSYELAMTTGNIPYIAAEYGVGYYLYLIMIIGYFSVIVYFIVRAIMRRDAMSLQVIFNTLEVIITAIMVTWVEIASPGAHAIVAILYIIEAVLVLRMVRKLKQYDVSNVVNTYINNYNKLGFITVDQNMNYLGSNSVAKKMLPELQALKLDVNIYSKVGYMKTTVENMLREKHFEFIEVEGRILKCSIRRFTTRHKVIGYLIEMEDDTNQQKYLSLVNKHNSALEEDVKQKRAHIHDIQDQIIVGMATIIENRDLSTGEHIKRTGEVLELFTRELQKSEDYKDIFTDSFCEAIVKAAPMHDIGKIVVEDNILRKEGKFTDEEFEKMKCHAQKGGQIVKEVLEGVEEKSFVEVAANMAAYHHEHWNGNGYEKGMAGTEIPIEARVMAFADVFDALVSVRCYKDAYSCEQAIQIIEESLGTQFDPGLGKVFLRLYDQLKALYEKDNNVYE